MPRPKDENNKALPAAHVRLPNATALRTAAILAISTTPAGTPLVLKRKNAIAERAIDHVFDGSPPPGINDMHKDVWAAAVSAVMWMRDEARS